jgi:hypothetical protein
VRCYTTKAMKGRTLFKCTRCEHSVTTRSFQTTNGNLRTQAAMALNQHAAVAHCRPVPFPGRPGPVARLALLAEKFAMFSNET